jgi:hypothetical protein
MSCNCRKQRNKKDAYMHSDVSISGKLHYLFDTDKAIATFPNEGVGCWYQRCERHKRRVPICGPPQLAWCRLRCNVKYEPQLR